MDIWRLPPILIIHLKRFQYTTHSRRKLHKLVRFPIDDLDLSPYVAGDCEAENDGWATVPSNVGEGMDGNGGMEFLGGGRMTKYTLYAVIHHIGALSAGHYVASIKSEQDGKWYCFNDSRVSRKR